MLLPLQEGTLLLTRETSLPLKKHKNDESRTVNGRILTRLRFVHAALHRDGAETEADDDTRGRDARAHATTRLVRTNVVSSSSNARTHALASSSSSTVVKQHSRGAWIHHPSKRRDASVVVGFERARPSVRSGCSLDGACSTKDDASIHLDRVRTGKGDGTRRTFA